MGIEIQPTLKGKKKRLLGEEKRKAFLRISRWGNHWKVHVPDPKLTKREVRKGTLPGQSTEEEN